MQEYEFSLTHIFPYSVRILGSARNIRVNENLYSCIF